MEFLPPPFFFYLVKLATGTLPVSFLILLPGNEFCQCFWNTKMPLQHPFYVVFHLEHIPPFLHVAGLSGLVFVHEMKQPPFRSGKRGVAPVDLILQPGPGSWTSLSFSDRPAAYFIFRAPSGWSCDQTCQHPDGGGGGLCGHLTEADRKLSFRRKLFYKCIDKVLWGREQKPPELGVWKCLQGSRDKYRGSGQVWKLLCGAPGTRVRAEGAPRWQRSLFTRGGWTWEIPLRRQLVTNRPLSQ